MIAVAEARSNIALVKYWGKRDAALNLPAAGSLSLTVDALTTTTTVELRGAADDELAALGASTARLDALCEAARAEGALGAKLTGAGGGGAVIALAPGREEDVASAWRALGHEAFVTSAGASHPAPVPPTRTP